MKKILPWILVVLFAGWIVSTIRPKAEPGFHTREFGQLPVVLEGRVQPWDSVARNTLLQLRGKQTLRYEEHDATGRTTFKTNMTAVAWALETMFRPDLANARPVFRVDHPDLKGFLGIPIEEKEASWNQLAPKFTELRSLATNSAAIESQRRSPYDNAVLRLYHAGNLFIQLKNTLQTERSTDFIGDLLDYLQNIDAGRTALFDRQAGKEYDEAAFNKLAEHVSTFDFIQQASLPLVVPPIESSEGSSNWRNLGDQLIGVLRGEKLHECVTYYAAMGSAYRSGDSEKFNRAVADYNQKLADKYSKEKAKGVRESFFNTLEPFYKACVVYVGALILGLTFWVTNGAWARRSALGLVGLAFVVHTAGLVFRMVLEGRPPVTNLYSSAIFIGWGACLLGIVLERFYKDGVGIVVSSFIGFVTLIIAHNLALGGDTMIMLRAVLDTNFWLATHVVVVTLGYASTFVAGFLALIYVFLGFFTRRLHVPLGEGAIRGMSAAARVAGGPALHAVTNIAARSKESEGEVSGKTLSRMVYAILCFATLFSFVGTVLGGIWADQSWGRFWGWDPKENGALMIVIWNALILHARWGGLVKERGIMNLAIFGNIVTAWSWFGTNMLGIGLHAYGFTDSGFKWLVSFMVSQVLFIIVGCLPLKMWTSYATGSNGRPPKLEQPVAEGSAV